MDFYVYKHIRLDTGTVFYVGKGRGYRAYNKRTRNLYWKNIVNNCGYRVEIVHKNLSEEQSFKLEKEVISKYKSIGQCEANMSLGGEGASGIIRSEETKRKMRIAHKMRDCKHPKKRRLKMSRASKGKKMSDEARLNMSKSKLGLHVGEANGMFKYKCKVDGIEYSCILELANILNVDRRVVDYRCRSTSPKWKNWEFV